MLRIEVKSDIDMKQFYCAGKAELLYKKFKQPKQGYAKKVRHENV